jgi:hypothetical protein
MGSVRKANLPRIEWEGLANKWEVSELADSPVLPPGSQKIEIWRDEQYKIGAKIVGTPAGSPSDLLLDQGQPGKIIPDYRIEGSSSLGRFFYQLDHCIVNGVSIRWPEQFEGDLKTYRARRAVTREETPRAWLTEWYLNAHDGALLYPRNVQRDLKETYHRKRELPEEDAVFEGNWPASHGRYAYVDTPAASFIVERVPKELGPSWSRNLAIEYREAWGGIPNEGTRAAIANLVSFVMGRPLVRVGYTAYNARGYAIEEVAVSPLEGDLLDLCRRTEQPPVQLKKGRRADLFERLLRGLVPRYLELNDELNLDDVIWGYWVSDRLPLGADLPTLATSVEILKNSWYSSKKSKSRGVYMPREQFDELLDSELAQIDKKLETVEYGDRMARRIRGAYQLGANESFEIFFEEIGLPIRQTERHAIRARNPMAHGSLDLLDESRHQEMLDAKMAYRTLFNRTFLKLLGYDGAYIDYSAEGWPERQLDQVMGD